MRFRILIFLLPSVLLAVLALNSQAIYDGSEGSADQLIDASNDIYTPFVDTRFPATPQESRALQNAKKNVDYSAAPKTVASTAAANITEVKTKPDEAPAIISGNWSFEINDSVLKKVMVTLSQSENTVFGLGNFMEANSTFNVTASGTINMDKLNLDLMPSGTTNHYMLELTVSGDYAIGEYKAITLGGKSWTGEARGNRIIEE
jgi:hypothetical protein